MLAGDRGPDGTGKTSSVTAVSAAVSAITDKFRAVFDLTPRSSDAVNRQVAPIYADAPAMIRSQSRGLQQEDVDAVVDILIEWQVSSTGSNARRFYQNEKHRRGIVHRALQTYFRQQKRIRESRGPHEALDENKLEASGQASPIDVLLHDELDKRVNEALEKMSPTRRAVFVEKVFGELSHQEIADKLGIELWKVHSNMTGAYDTMREVARAVQEGRSPRFPSRGRPKGSRDSKPRKPRNERKRGAA